MTGVALVPAPVEVFGDGAELNDQVVGQVFRLDLAALFAPEAEECSLIIAHDDAGIRAADKVTTVARNEFDDLDLGAERRDRRLNSCTGISA